MNNFKKTINQTTNGLEETTSTSRLLEKQNIKINAKLSLISCDNNSHWLFYILH